MPLKDDNHGGRRHPHFSILLPVKLSLVWVIDVLKLLPHIRNQKLPGLILDPCQ